MSETPNLPVPAGRDAWSALARHTRARIALGRAGGSLRSASLLDFRLAHARARDAVLTEFQPGALAPALREISGAEPLLLRSAAGDKRTFLVRPDLGRQLAPDSRQLLRAHAAAWGRRDLAIIASDGLSAFAAERQIVPMLRALLPRLRAAGWSLYPVILVSYGRVKLQDEIGELLQARQTLMLLGERPGLGAPDSLGAYFTYQPRATRTDADRNCLSNIRPEGLPPDAAAQKLAELLTRSAQLQLSGVLLKDEAPPPELAP